jgi:hypothetical protein
MVGGKIAYELPAIRGLSKNTTPSKAVKEGATE